MSKEVEKYIGYAILLWVAYTLYKNYVASQAATAAAANGSAQGGADYGTLIGDGIDALDDFGD